MCIRDRFSTFWQTPSATHWRSFLCEESVFSPTSLFFVATDAYSQSLCEFFSVANVNRFLSVNHMKLTSFKRLFWTSESCVADCFSQLFSSVSSNQDHSEKWYILQHVVLVGALNDKFVAGLLDLIPVRLPRPQYPQCVRAWSAVAVTAVGANFDQIYFTK